MGTRTKTTLEALIEAGLLQEGEQLYASKTFAGESSPRDFVAELTGDGNVRIVSDGGDGSLNGRVCSATVAITLLYERPDSGWLNWKVERDGERVRLSTLRDEYDLDQRAPTLESLDHAAPEAGSLAVPPAQTEISRDFRN